MNIWLPANAIGNGSTKESTQSASNQKDRHNKRPKKFKWCLFYFQTVAIQKARIAKIFYNLFYKIEKKV